MKSKAFRLAILFSALISAVVIFFTFLFVFVLNMNIRRNQSEELFESAETIKNSMLDTFRPGIEKIPYYISFCVYENSVAEEILFTNDPFMIVLPQTNSKTKTFFEKNFFIDGNLNVLYCTTQFDVENKTYVVQVSLSLDLDWGQRLLYGLIPVVVLLLIPLVIFSSTVAFFITSQTMKPVKKIAQTAESISLNNLNEKFVLSGSDDEFDYLSLTFNNLLERLNTDFKREKQFTSDVSHELKTPLTVIAGHVNLIRRWGKDDPEQMENSLRRISAEVSSMKTIIENLLELSRLDVGKVSPDIRRVNISSLFERLRDDTFVWAPQAELKFSGLENDVFCDKEMLYEIFTIIVSNSVKYSDGNVRIEIFSEKTDAGIRIIIKDNGPGISAESLPHVLERFYRGDESHSRNKPGSGLGLAIVKSIMDVHKGTVSVFSDGKTGTSVILEFKD